MYQHEKELEDCLSAFREPFRLWDRSITKDPNSSVMTYSVSKACGSGRTGQSHSSEQQPAAREGQRLPNDSLEIVTIDAAEGASGVQMDSKELVRLAYTMNLHGKQRARLNPKTSCRDPQRLYARPLSEIRGDDIVRSSWRHGESGRNDLTAFRAAVRAHRHQERSNKNA